MLMLAYSSGLRAGEITHLKIGHIDTARMTVMVREGKGRKDRYTILSKVALDTLIKYLQLYRPTSFPGMPDRPITRTTMDKVIKFSKERACLKICRELLRAAAAKPSPSETWQQSLMRITGIDVTRCPLCQGRMKRKELYSGPP
jgi:integrase